MKENKTATAVIILEKRRPNKEGLFPVCLRITSERKSMYYRMKYPQKLPKDLQGREGKTIYLNENSFADVFKPKVKAEGLAIRKIFDVFIDESQKVISKLPHFTFEDFEKKYFNFADDNDVFAQLKKRAAELRNEGRISTAVAHECSLKSLQNFHGKTSLKFEDITVQFLKKYQNWMLDSGNAATTVGIYLRNIRTLFNNSAIEGINYPFGKKQFTIPTGTNTKKALTMNQVALIAAFEPIPGTWEARARDYWLFSYLGNGINVKDMARLKYSNISDDLITFVRAKTKNTNSKPVQIDIIITEQIGRILDKWGNKPALPDAYIFPILQPGMTHVEEYKAIQRTVHNINDNMKRIARHLEIDANLTTYVARHSFATVLKKSGASVEFIQEALGHTSAHTTQSYLAQFDTDKKREFAGKLLPKIG